LLAYLLNANHKYSGHGRISKIGTNVSAWILKMKEADGLGICKILLGSGVFLHNIVVSRPYITRSGYKTYQGRIPPLSILCSVNIKSTIFGWIVASKCKIECYSTLIEECPFK